MNTFKGRLILWLIVALPIPIGIFIWDGGYNATAMGWIVGVAVLALIVELIYKRLNRKL